MIIITGASDGLGKELARVYSKSGETVVNISRRECEFAQYNIKCDLTDSIAIEVAARKLREMDEPILALVHCAAVMSIEPLGKIQASEVKRVMDTNINAAIVLTSALTDRLYRDGTDVVNVASTVGTKGYNEQAAYGASKWAMRGFSANLQAEFKGKPNRAISFCVGGMRTHMAKKIGIEMTDPENWIDPAEIAIFMKQILDLPKNVEVSEIIINRK